MQKKAGPFFMFVAVILLCAGLIHLVGSVLTPFLIAILLVYLVDPLVRRLMHWRLSRTVSSVIVFSGLFLVMALAVLLFIPIVQKQITILIDVVPNMIAWVQTKIVPWLQAHVGLNEELINISTLKKILADNLVSAGGVANWFMHKILASGAHIIDLCMSLVLIPVVTFYLLCDWNKVLSGLRNLIPRQSEPTIMKLVKESDDVLGAFLRGQFLVMISLGIIYSIGLTAIGLQIGVSIGLMAGFLMIVPYLGTIVGIVTASIAAYVQFGTFSSVLLVWLVFAIGQIIEGFYLTPNLVGNRIGLHPVAVIFALLVGGTLFGFTGVLLALPVAAVIMVWLRYLHKQYQHSDLYQGTC